MPYSFSNSWKFVTAWGRVVMDPVSTTVLESQHWQASTVMVPNSSVRKKDVSLAHVLSKSRFM